MIFNAKDIKLGNQDVKKVMLGDKVIWDKSCYLFIEPTSIWLQESNNYEAFVNILSNVRWNTN